MGNATNITYGDYNFQRDGGPIPFLTINKEFKRLEDGTKIGSKYIVTLQGELNLLPSGVSGYTNLNDMQDLLASGFSQDCQEFKVTCGASTLIQQYPRINNITFSPSNDNWTQSTDFNIQMEWDGETYDGLYLDTISDSWDFQIHNGPSYYDIDLPGGTGDNNMYMFTLSHNLSAKGIQRCENSRPAWQEARDWVISAAAHCATGHIEETSGIYNVDTTSLSGWNHSRVQRVDVYDGHFHLDEQWIFADTGLNDNAGAAIEDFSASVSFDGNNGLTTTSINGTIEGLEVVDYGTNPGDYNIVQTKYANASGYWEAVRPKLYGRASVLSDGFNMNPVALSYNISHTPSKGTISYNYSYDNRPCNFIANALTETITVSDDNPTDVFAEIAILGRPFGPVLQNLSTVTASRRTVNISAIMGPTTGCSDIVTSVTGGRPDVSSILCDLYTDISGENIHIYKSQDQESWNIKTGAYSRNVQWTWTPCTGTAPTTTFC